MNIENNLSIMRSYLLSAKKYYSEQNLGLSLFMTNNAYVTLQKINLRDDAEYTNLLNSNRDILSKLIGGSGQKDDAWQTLLSQVKQLIKITEKSIKNGVGFFKE